MFAKTHLIKLDSGEVNIIIVYTASRSPNKWWDKFLMLVNNKCHCGVHNISLYVCQWIYVIVYYMYTTCRPLVRTIVGLCRQMLWPNNDLSQSNGRIIVLFEFDGTDQIADLVKGRVVSNTQNPSW